ncbi:hypothetical protein V565_332360, partial [Rhizoctonia solani 123E]
MLAKESDVQQSGVDELASTSSAAAHTAHALVTESALETIRTDNQQVSIPQPMTASSHSRPIDSPFLSKTPDEPESDLLAQFDNNPNLVPDLNIQVSIEPIEHKGNFIITKRLGTPLFMLATESNVLHSPADELVSATNDATLTMHVLTAKSALETLRTDNEQIASLQASIASTHSCLIDPPQTLEATTELATDRSQLAQSNETSISVSSVDLRA